MAPRRTGRERERAQKELHAEWRPLMAFYPPDMDNARTERVARMAATDFNEHGASVCHAAGTTGLLTRDVQLFSCFVAAGLVPPASLFFLAVVASDRKSVV